MEIKELQSDAFFSKAIKKAYLKPLGDEIKKMIKSIEFLHATIQELESHQKDLEHELEIRDKLLQSSEYKVAIAIKEMMHGEIVNIVESHVPQITEKLVTNHLKVTTETIGRYDPYSGSDAPYYESDSRVEWQ